MLKFYYSGAPNPTKVALFLEETGTPYEAIPIDTRKGEQHKAEFLAVNPNAKLPAIVDGDVTVFDSSAILLYLAEKTGKFLPVRADKARAELLSWMFFVVVRGRPLFRAIRAFSKLCAQKDSLRHQSLCVRSAAPCWHSQCTPCQAKIHAGRQLYDR